MRSFHRTPALLIAAAFFSFSLRLFAEDVIYTKVDVKPVPVKTPPPIYPEELKREGVSGVVAVSIVIDEKGLVASATVVKSSNPNLNDAAIAAVKKWKFKPGQKDGEPVKTRVTIPINFSLDE